MNVKFLHQTDDRVVIDVRRAMLAGAREVEVGYEPVTQSIQVNVRKTKAGKPIGGEGSKL